MKQYNFPDKESIVFMAAGAVIMLIFSLAVFHFQQKHNPADKLAFKAGRVDLVNKIQLDLASSSEAEKSSVMAITDQDSKTYADQARAASADAQDKSRALESLLASGGTQGEKALSDQYSRLYSDLMKIDNELLDLAVKNTNLKAYDLTYNSGAALINSIIGSLQHVIETASGPRGDLRIVLSCYESEISLLRIQTLLPPHIAEENDKKMDELEGRMNTEDKKIRMNFDKLKGLKLTDNPDLVKAVLDYDQFTSLKGRILALSRENTNVKSLSIALNQKRSIMFQCLDVLEKLKTAIMDEPIVGVTYGKPARPR